MGPTNPKFAKLVRNAIKSYAKDVKEDDVVMLMDTTIFGSGKEGFVITEEKLVIKDLSQVISCNFSEIQKMRIKRMESRDSEFLYLETTKGTILVYCTTRKNSELVIKAINAIVMSSQGLAELPYSIEIQS